MVDLGRRRVAGQTRDREGLARAIVEGFLIGYAYPLRALASIGRPVPVHEKLAREWSRRLLCRYAVRLQPVPDSAPLLRGRRCLWVAPHRGVADFFVHKEIIEGRGATLSRFLLAGIFPLLWLATRSDRSVWFFRRDRLPSREAFYRWLDGEFERCPLDGLIVYAEGHRNRSDRPLPLKAGLIRYAYRRGLPVQVLATAGTERVVDEKARIVRHGVVVTFRIEPPIEPGRYSDERSFYVAVRDRFERSFLDLVARTGCPGGDAA